MTVSPDAVPPPRVRPWPTTLHVGSGPNRPAAGPPTGGVGGSAATSGDPERRTSVPVGERRTDDFAPDDGQAAAGPGGRRIDLIRSDVGAASPSEPPSATGPTEVSPGFGGRSRLRRPTRGSGIADPRAASTRTLGGIARGGARRARGRRLEGPTRRWGDPTAAAAATAGDGPPSPRTPTRGRAGDHGRRWAVRATNDGSPTSAASSRPRPGRADAAADALRAAQRPTTTTSAAADGAAATPTRARSGAARKRRRRTFRAAVAGASHARRTRPRPATGSARSTGSTARPARRPRRPPGSARPRAEIARRSSGWRSRPTPRGSRAETADAACLAAREAVADCDERGRSRSRPSTPIPRRGRARRGRVDRLDEDETLGDALERRRRSRASSACCAAIATAMTAARRRASPATTPSRRAAGSSS